MSVSFNGYLSSGFSGYNTPIGLRTHKRDLEMWRPRDVGSSA